MIRDRKGQRPIAYKNNGIDHNKRRTLSRLSWTAFATTVACEIPFWRNIPATILPIAWAAPSVLATYEKDANLVVLNDRPLNIETPAHLLDADVTPCSRLFVRNNGYPPDSPDPSKWRLEIKGEAINRPFALSLNDLKNRYRNVSYNLVLECAGNGRSEFFPTARGNQWTTGAVGCVRWTGVPLRNVLRDCEIDKSAVYLAYEGADTHLSGKPNQKPISRGIPMAKADDPHCLLAWQMNGQPLPAMHGYPLRLVIPGYPGSCSGKWLKTLLVRDRVHDGPKMGGKSYRMPCHPVQPKQKVPNEEMCIIEEMPVKSLITFPKSGTLQPLRRPLDIRGHAWTGHGAIRNVKISIDFGATWQTCDLKKAENRFAWQRFSTRIDFPRRGYYEIWARAVDESGRSQPMVVPGWNPKGYLNNACHRVAVRVEA